MNSISKKLSRYISISISVLLVSIFLITDISVDTWISNEFDRAMTNKANLLTTLVSEDVEKVDFDFADEFMPEFSGKNDPEYFQLWLDGKVFERSKTLELFEINELPKIDLALNQTSISNITLPDGRSGKMYFTKLIPQVDSDIREDFGITVEEFAKTQKPMELAYAISNEKLKQILWFVDIIFLGTSIFAVFAVRKIVSFVVIRGLKPLENLNNELKTIKINSGSSTLSVAQLPIELISIAEGINHFISENRLLYSREKRISSDIAHELKTPITELLNLSEVAIKFPHEKQISTRFKHDVLKISERLRSIVNGILLLHKSTSSAKLKKTHINVEHFFEEIIERENKLAKKILFTSKANNEVIYISEVAFETILSNLVSNALHYSPDNLPVSISISALSDINNITFKISNTCRHQYSQSDLEHFFEPLWQKDQSRTSSERYGLGLAIVKSYCDKINAALSVTLDPQQTITFTLTL